MFVSGQARNALQPVRDHGGLSVGTKKLTVLEHPFHIEAVGGAGLVIGASL